MNLIAVRFWPTTCTKICYCLLLTTLTRLEPSWFTQRFLMRVLFIAIAILIVSVRGEQMGRAQSQPSQNAFFEDQGAHSGRQYYQQDAPFQHQNNADEMPHDAYSQSYQLQSAEGARHENQMQVFQEQKENFEEKYRNIPQRSMMQQESIINQPSPSNMFHTVESLPRSQVVNFLTNVLKRVVEGNDKYSHPSRQVDHVQIGSDVRESAILSPDDFDLDRGGASEGGLSATDSDSDSVEYLLADVELQFDIKDVASLSSEELVDAMMERLFSSKLNVRNLTFLVALVYMDRLSRQSLVYCSGRTAYKLFSSCLLVASKVHQNELGRETLANALGLHVPALLRIESAVTAALRDLTVHPNELAKYVTPLLQVQNSLTIGPDAMLQHQPHTPEEISTPKAKEWIEVEAEVESFQVPAPLPQSSCIDHDHDHAARPGLPSPSPFQSQQSNNSNNRMPHLPPHLLQRQDTDADTQQPQPPANTVNTASQEGSYARP